MMPEVIPQDTIRPQIIVRIKTDNLLPDSVFRRLDERPAFAGNADSGRPKPVRSRETVIITDTTSLCSRNPVADLTFTDPDNFIRSLPADFKAGQLPYFFKARENIGHRKNTLIGTNLVEGHPIMPELSHSDWLSGLIILVPVLFLVVRNASRSVFPEFTRFVTMRGINDRSSRDLASLMTWQSAIKNFISFLIFGIFAYSGAVSFGAIPDSLPPFVFMLISVGLVIFGITSRHVICKATGNLSGKEEVFNEYLTGVYQAYRYGAVPLYILLVLFTYTVLLPAKIGFITGTAVLGSFYVIRVTRLALIFVKRDISIFYLILYLCALEILPVLILVKYFTNSF